MALEPVEARRFFEETIARCREPANYTVRPG